ncbi:hypothetical protein THASP1DRAFT_28444 [Thamnocephalis sphaerospora]|uniref:Up-regulated during septation protein 1 domain-containing protein n=1 Tax=Thamnocephalis sphaerospora TaxID=78915 RepID=A0A4V1IX43_9FUNG|nr:hypothetical protein THASP1DRAFT_28444 [Thamnocephalis sphaerospora]|eukprot:RKP09759.1 hypothetical protein THASP1DRAFT_28444 [Thamnocephalis sphaerospora]
MLQARVGILRDAHAKEARILDCAVSLLELHRSKKNKRAERKAVDELQIAHEKVDKVLLDLWRLSSRVSEVRAQLNCHQSAVLRAGLKRVDEMNRRLLAARERRRKSVVASVYLSDADISLMDGIAEDAAAQGGQAGGATLKSMHPHSRALMLAEERIKELEVALMETNEELEQARCDAEGAKRACEAEASSSAEARYQVHEVERILSMILPSDGESLADIERASDQTPDMHTRGSESPSTSARMLRRLGRVQEEVEGYRGRIRQLEEQAMEQPHPSADTSLELRADNTSLSSREDSHATAQSAEIQAAMAALQAEKCALEEETAHLREQLEARTNEAEDLREQLDETCRDVRDLELCQESIVAPLQELYEVLPPADNDLPEGDDTQGFSFPGFLSRVETLMMEHERVYNELSCIQRLNTPNLHGNSGTASERVSIATSASRNSQVSIPAPASVNSRRPSYAGTVASSARISACGDPDLEHVQDMLLQEINERSVSPDATALSQTNGYSDAYYNDSDNTVRLEGMHAGQGFTESVTQPSGPSLATFSVDTMGPTAASSNTSMARQTPPITVTTLSRDMHSHQTFSYTTESTPSPALGTRSNRNSDDSGGVDSDDSTDAAHLATPRGHPAAVAARAMGLTASTASSAADMSLDEFKFGSVDSYFTATSMPGSRERSLLMVDDSDQEHEDQTAYSAHVPANDSSMQAMITSNAYANVEQSMQAGYDGRTAGEMALTDHIATHYGSLTSEDSASGLLDGLPPALKNGHALASRSFDASAQAHGHADESSMSTHSASPRQTTHQSALPSPVAPHLDSSLIHHEPTSPSAVSTANWPSMRSQFRSRLSLVVSDESGLDRLLEQLDAYVASSH